MRDEYDFSKAKRGAVISPPGKTRITITLDGDVMEHFRVQAEAEGVGHLTAINSLLRGAMAAAGSRQHPTPNTQHPTPNVSPRR